MFYSILAVLFLNGFNSFDSVPMATLHAFRSFIHKSIKGPVTSSPNMLAGKLGLKALKN